MSDSIWPPCSVESVQLNIVRNTARLPQRTMSLRAGRDAASRLLPIQAALWTRKESRRW